MVLELVSKRQDAKGFEQSVFKIDSLYGLEDIDRWTMEADIRWELNFREFELVAIECDGANWFAVLYLYEDDWSI
jgi:hypothetical protein